MHVLLDLSALDGSEWTREVGDEVLSVLLTEDSVPENSWLLKVGVWMSVVESTGLTLQGLLAPGISWILLWTSLSVWLMVDGGSLVSVVGVVVSLIVGNSSSVWAVNWHLVVVGSESVSVGIWVGEESSLEHLVVGW